MDRRKFFDEIAQEWESDHQNHKERVWLRKLFKHISLAKGDAVLDMGCGTGRLVSLLRRAIGKKGLLVESDFSAEMLGIAKSKYFERNLFFIQSDAQKIPLKEDTFDAIICFALFPHLPDKKNALEEFHRILKSGKSIYIAHLMSREELNRFHSQVKGPIKKDFLPDEKEMERLFSSTGFCEIAIKNEPSLYIAKAKA